MSSPRCQCHGLFGQLRFSFFFYVQTPIFVLGAFFIPTAPEVTLSGLLPRMSLPLRFWFTCQVPPEVTLGGVSPRGWTFRLRVCQSFAPITPRISSHRLKPRSVAFLLGVRHGRDLVMQNCFVKKSESAAVLHIIVVLMSNQRLPLCQMYMDIW